MNFFSNLFKKEKGKITDDIDKELANILISFEKRILAMETKVNKEIDDLNNKLGIASVNKNNIVGSKLNIQSIKALICPPTAQPVATNQG